MAVTPWSVQGFNSEIVRWGTQTRLFSISSKKWLRARPFPGCSPLPVLKTAGTSRFKTQPDALFVAISADKKAVDLIAVEHCGSIQNLADKRSRYAPSNQATMISVTKKWLDAHSRTATAGPKIRSILQITQPQIELPVRFIRILYVLKDHHYKQWMKEGIFMPHEYFIRWSSIRSYNSQLFRVFMKRLAPESHFYVTRGL